VGGGIVLTAFARRRFDEPFVGLSLALLLVLLFGWIVRPRVTLYVTLFLTAVSEQVTLWWFPFAKNLSSRESIAYVADAATISPLELSLLTGCGISMLKRYAETRRVTPPTALRWPLTFFTAMTFYGVFQGLQGGGDLRIAVIESRPIFYIFLVYVIVVNECPRPAHLRYALGAILAGVVLQALLSIEHFGRLDPARRESIDTLTEHGAVLGQNLLLITALTFLLLGVKQPLVKFGLIVGAVPVVYVMLEAQRRAGVAGLIVAGAALAVTLFWRRRVAFWIATPVMVTALVGYSAAFWNSQSGAGFAAQAIKSVISPESVSQEDRSSDLYRLMEGYDLYATIHASPLRGLGFGQAFYRPLPLPDISLFELNAYLPHNTILWIWIKMGFVGFASMFYLFFKGIMLGADRIRRLPTGTDLVVMVATTLFVMMYVVYTWVDISWSARNTVVLGFAFATCAHPVWDHVGDRPGGQDTRPSQESREPHALRV
jgi:hypothetical protein